MLQTASSQRHPFFSLLLLLFLAFSGAIVFQGIAMVAGYLIFGSEVTLNSAIYGTDQQSLTYFRIFTLLSFTGTLILPSLIFAKMESPDEGGFLKIRKPVPLAPALLAIVVIFTSLPLLGFFVELNKDMKLPGFLKFAEDWMRLKENEAATLVTRILAMNSRVDLNFNLLMVAIIPAIGEEFFFRGCIQQTFGRWFKSHHTAIWLTAIVFSAIHEQFFGFLPRMLLGALLGYLFIWGKSIWLPVIAHFTNNAITVTGYYIYRQRGLDPAKLDDVGSTNPGVLLGSAILTALVLYIVWRSGGTSEQTGERDHG